MYEYLTIKLLHILCFVYWLGGDLGTFYASRFVGRSDISPEARGVAMKIMMGCDQGPRLSMPLILPLGLHLAYLLGLFKVEPLWLGVSWLLCLAWTASVLIMHFSHSSRLVQILAAYDFRFRSVVAIGLAALAIYSLLSGNILTAQWTAIKLFVFALLVGCGLLIRVQLKPLIGVWGQLMAQGPTPETDRIIHRSIQRCLPYVMAIWVGLLINAALGLKFFPQ